MANVYNQQEEWARSTDFLAVCNDLLEIVEAGNNEGDYLTAANKLKYIYNEMAKAAAALKANVIYREHQTRAARPEPKRRQTFHRTAEAMLNCEKCSRPIYCPQKNNNTRFMRNMKILLVF